MAVIRAVLHGSGGKAARLATFARPLITLCDRSLIRALPAGEGRCTAASRHRGLTTCRSASGSTWPRRSIGPRPSPRTGGSCSTARSTIPPTDIGKLAAELAALGGERLIGIDLLGGIATLLSATAACRRRAAWSMCPAWPSTAPDRAASAARPRATPRMPASSPTSCGCAPATSGRRLRDDDAGRAASAGRPPRRSGHRPDPPPQPHALPAQHHPPGPRARPRPHQCRAALVA